MKAVVPANEQRSRAFEFFAKGADADVTKKLWEDHEAGKNEIEIDVTDPDLPEPYDAELERAMSDPRAKIISTDEPDGVPRIYLYNNVLGVKTAAELVQMRADEVVEIRDPFMVKFLKRTDERFEEYLKSRGIPEDTDLTAGGYEEENAEYERIQQEEVERISSEMGERRQENGFEKND